MIITSFASGLPLEFRRERAGEYLKEILATCTKEMEDCPFISREIWDQLRSTFHDDLVNARSVSDRPFVAAMRDWDRKNLIMFMTELQRTVWASGLKHARVYYGSDAVEAAIKNV